MKPQDVTTDDVINTALNWDRQCGIQADARDCRVQQHPTHLIVEDSGGQTLLPDAVWKWDVLITAKAPPNAHPGRYLVPVEMLSGDIVPTDCIPLDP